MAVLEIYPIEEVELVVCNAVDSFVHIRCQVAVGVVGEFGAFVGVVFEVHRSGIG